MQFRMYSARVPAAGRPGSAGRLQRLHRGSRENTGTLIAVPRAMVSVVVPVAWGPDTTIVSTLP